MRPAVFFAAVLLYSCAKHRPHLIKPDTSRETIYVLRSIREEPAREPSARAARGCDERTIGFTPYASDAERFYSLWSVLGRPTDGRVIDAGKKRVASLRGCFGPTTDRRRQHFQAEITMGSLSFEGRGECLALGIDVPERDMFPVRCQLVLSGLPAPYASGLLTTNTITSRAAFGGETDPPGYTQASIATIRLWRAR